MISIYSPNNTVDTYKSKCTFHRKTISSNTDMNSCKYKEISDCKNN